MQRRAAKGTVSKKYFTPDGGALGRVLLCYAGLCEIVSVCEVHGMSITMRAANVLPVIQILTSN